MIKKITAFPPIAKRPKFAFFLQEFLYFGFKQAWACLFGGLMLFGIIATHFFWPADIPLARYDFLFFYAIAIQVVFIAFKLESWEEMRVIFIFHVVGTVMELFKTHVGSWEYPEENLIRIAGVPLFSGFMYSAVGSYIARVWRIFEFKFTDYPSKGATAVLCIFIYVNFFTHHYFYDIRVPLMVITVMLYGRTWIYFQPHETYHKMPLLLGFFLVSFFIWIAENTGTFASAWRYPEQAETWTIVSPHKMGAWFLLMIISFVLVTFIKNRKEDYYKLSSWG